MTTDTRPSVPRDPSGLGADDRHPSGVPGAPHAASSVSRRNRLAAGVAALALGAGVLSAGPATTRLASASPTVLTYAAVSAVQPPAAGRAALLVDLGRSSLLGASSSGSLGTDVQKRSIKPIVDWLKKNAPKHYDKLKAAAKRGKTAVKKWFDNLPKPIRVTIQFLWSGTIWSLIEALLKYFTS